MRPRFVCIIIPALLLLVWACSGPGDAPGGQGSASTGTTGPGAEPTTAGPPDPTTGATPTQWLSFASRPCNDVNRVYCIEAKSG